MVLMCYFNKVNTGQFENKEAAINKLETKQIYNYNKINFIKLNFFVEFFFKKV